MVLTFRCPYCNKSYSRESWFRRHACEKKKRFEESHRMDFHRGIILYKHWRIRNGYLRNGKKIMPEDFIKSHFYNSFMKLVAFTSENWVITSIKYMDFLIDYRIPEIKWCSPDTLRLYREHIRRSDDPINQSKITCNEIKNFCSQNKIDYREFFSKVSPGTAYQMILYNKISPWVLFGYDRSVNDLLSRMNDDWISSVNEIINNRYWIDKVTSCENIQKTIQAECERQLNDE
jgi:hypothetical protein